jgi:uncharacterized membrane protein YqjE
MNTPAHAPDLTGPGSLLSSMARTRLELALLDLETHVGRTVGALALGFAALVIVLIAAGFIGLTVIVYFWDTHRLIAAVLVTSSYLALAAAFAATARSRWLSRPPAFAAVLRELERDRDSLRGRL